MAEKDDDFLTPEDIDNLLNAEGNQFSGQKETGASQGQAPQQEDAGGQQPAADNVEAADGQQQKGEVGAEDGQQAAQAESVEAADASGPSAEGGDEIRNEESAEQLLEQAEADLQAAIDPDFGAGFAAEQASPFEFPEFDQGEDQSQTQPMDVDAIGDVELDVSIELGRAELLIEDVLKLKEGSIVPLDKLAGDPVDIVVNGKLVARGEVLVLNDNFCVRVAEILPPDV